MFILNFYYNNSVYNGSGCIKFQEGPGEIRKWSVLTGGPEAIEILQLIAISCLGKNFLPLATRLSRSLSRGASAKTQFEFEMVRHAPRDCSASSKTFFAAGLKIMPDGRVISFGKNERCHCRTDIPWRYHSVGSGIRKHFALAYGSRWNVHTGTDTFDFSSPDKRLDRFASLFSEKNRLTDSADFLQRLHYRFVKNRAPAVHSLKLLSGELKKHFAIDTSSWFRKDADFQKILAGLTSWQYRLISPILDAVRHIIDASPHDLIPTDRPGIILFVHPQISCSDGILPSWLELFDRLFPNIQFIIILPEESVDQLPAELYSKRLKIPEEAAEKNKRKKINLGRLGQDTALLIDVDGRLPNLALMKVSNWFQRQGIATKLVRLDNWKVDSAEIVYASCIFNFERSQHRVEMLRKKFGNRLKIGGSGVNLKHRLPPEIEAAPADYDLYPALGNRAIGFLSRGCTRKCRFCLVPEKEGLPRQVADLDDILQGRQHLVLLDDNILSFYEADRLLEEMAARDIQVNFNQTLDIRLVDQHRANLLRRIKCANYSFSRTNYHFSLNDLNERDIVRHNYELFNFRPRKDNVEFVCMYGFNTTLAEDVERFRFLRSLPGAYVFVQEYRPIPGGEKADLNHFFTGKEDELIDQLVKIVFPQNMKSMEKYYRWLSLRYFEAFGKLHDGLVDTIFKYNQRDRKGLYIVKMLGR